MQFLNIGILNFCLDEKNLLTSFCFCFFLVTTQLFLQIYNFIHKILVLLQGCLHSTFFSYLLAIYLVVFYTIIADYPEIPNDNFLAPPFTTYFSVSVIYNNFLELSGDSSLYFHTLEPWMVIGDLGANIE